MDHRWRDLGLIGAVCWLTLFFNLGATRLWDRDEPRNAGCAWEMLQRGDWVVPVFNAELRGHKPVLLYWLMMSSYGVFGVSEFSARFWSAALACGTVLCTYGIGRRLFDASVGRWSAVMLASCLMFDMAGRAATPDSPLIFLCTLSLWVFVRAGFPAGASGPGEFTPLSRLAVAAMGAVMGAAVLAKGPVGFLLPMAVSGMFLLIVRRPVVAADADSARKNWRQRVARVLRVFTPRHFFRTAWSMRPLTALAVAAAVAVPWYVWVGLRTDGEFLRAFFFEHHFDRATQSMEGHRGPFLLFYVGAILVGFFPWSVFAVPMVLETIRGIRRGDAWSRGLIFAACWVSVYVVLFSCARTKLPSYVTPCYPGLALLTGVFLCRWMRGESRVSIAWLKAALAIAGLVGLGLLIGLPIAAQRFLPGEAALGVLGLIPLAGAAVGLWLLHLRQQSAQAAVAFAAMAVLFTAALFGGALPRVSRHQQSHELWAAMETQGRVPQIGSFGCLEPSWVFYVGRPIAELRLDQAEVFPRPWQPKPRPQAAEFFSSGPDRFIITTARQWDELQRNLPPSATVLAECPYLFEDERLLLIGRRAEVAAGDRGRRE